MSLLYFTDINAFFEIPSFHDILSIQWKWRDQFLYKTSPIIFFKGQRSSDYGNYRKVPQIWNTYKTIAAME